MTRLETTSRLQQDSRRGSPRLHRRELVSSFHKPTVAKATTLKARTPGVISPVRKRGLALTATSHAGAQTPGVGTYKQTPIIDIYSRKSESDRSVESRNVGMAVRLVGRSRQG